MSPSVLLAAAGITKQFGENGVVANDNATLKVGGGTIHALVGENGAGKSTLMHILSGTLQPDAGTIELRGEIISHRTPADTLAAGIVISFQHPRLVPTLTVWENLILGAEPRTLFGTIDRRRAKQHIAERSFQISGVDMETQVSLLSSGQIRLVSLMAAMIRLPADKPGILILDEPTAACGPSDTDQIIAAMKATSDAGHGVIYITHRIGEVTDVADEVTVMKSGACIANLKRPFTAARVSELMLGEGTPQSPGIEEQPLGRATTTGEPVLTATGVTLRDGNRVLLDDVSFGVRAGEILGLTGVRESGIEAIEEVLGGVRRPSSGKIVFNDRVLTGLSPRALRRCGVGYVPTDRLLRGASMESTVAENMIVLERRQLNRAGVFLPAQVRRYGRKLAREFSIDATLNAPLNRLSGGNIQKVILSRELAEQPRLLIICEPSWGLDIRSRQMIGERIREAANAGAAVVLISTDMDEVLDFADTVGAFYAGRLSEIVPVARTNRQSLGHLVFGSSQEDEDHHA